MLFRSARFAAGVGPEKSLVAARPAIVSWAHAAGLRVTPWKFQQSNSGGFGDVTAEMRHHLREWRVDAVITAVRVEDGDPHFYEKFMPTLTRAAREAGVAQFIHSGAVGAGDNAARFPGLGWENVPGLLDRLNDQGAGERILRASGLNYKIGRAHV